MYEEYFSLSGSPFKLNPDPKFFFGSRSHNKAMAYLHYGLKQAEGFIVITGPIGSGKTMVISQLLDQLRDSNILAAQLLTSNIAPEELLDHILSAFRIEPEGEGRTGKLEAFEDYLFDQLNRGRRVLLIMDEAQNLPFETLEELRMLSNLDYDGTPLFQVFLVGQPEFRETMQSARLEQLRQRVIASYHLENLTLEETREYILHRLAVAGWRQDPVITEGAFEKIFEGTGGRPRRINTVANRLLLFCALEEIREATADVAEKVLGELHEENLQAQDDAPEGDGEKLAPPPMAMPLVRKIAEEQPAEGKRISGDDVVVPFDNHRARVEMAASSSGEKDEAPKKKTGDGEMSADEKPQEEKQKPKKNKSQAAKPASARAAGGSVFDRLKAARSEEDDAPGAATLEDVALAIASVSTDQSTETAPEAEPQSEAGNDNETAEAVIGEVVDDGPSTPEAPIAPLKSVRSKEWREQVSKSINDTRDELKEAHASVGRLKKSLAEMQRRRGASREKIVASIARAESLLSDLQKSWR